MLYKIEKAKGRTIVTFAKAPPVQTRKLLNDFGYKYHAPWKCWIGPFESKELEKQLAGQAEKFSKLGEKIQKTQTLCGECDTYTCSWIHHCEPVDGWDAEPTIINSGSLTHKEQSSYFVKSCPLFTLRRRK